MTAMKILTSLDTSLLTVWLPQQPPIRSSPLFRMAATPLDAWLALACRSSKWGQLFAGTFEITGFHPQQHLLQHLNFPRK